MAAGSRSETAAEMPLFFDELVAAGVDVLPGGRAAAPRARQRRRQDRRRALRVVARGHPRRRDRRLGDRARAARRAGRAARLRRTTMRTPSSSSAGNSCATEQAARAAAAREVDPDADEATVIDRIKSDHPDTFEGALEAYRDAMHPSAPTPHRARPRDGPGRRADRRHRRRPSTCATSCRSRPTSTPAAFDREPKGIYVVTPSVDGDPNAMREHNLASISNTSIHEAYPGHHLQLDAARRHGSLTRLLADAPEFVEGWGMYSELLMREQGFDAGPAFRVALHTDAIWRACRIILDVRMHRGELTRRRGDRVPGRADELRARERARRGPLVHATARPIPCRTCWDARCCWDCAPTSRHDWATGSA